MSLAIPIGKAALPLSKLAFLMGFLASVTASAADPSAPLPPELATLDAQFVALQSERVSGPFDEGLQKLIAGYLERLKTMIAEEKAARNLDGVVALEAEQESVVFKGIVPETDDGKTPEKLKELRGIYREAHAKLVAARAENMKTLTLPLAARLVQMEGDFTKGDRIDDAKTVREYREALGESTAKAAGAPGLSAPGGEAKAALQPAKTLALKDGVENSLGMKFLPVKGTDVLFCIHEVRYKDYAAYAAEAQTGGGPWKDQSAGGFTPTDRAEDHPVIRVSWDDAQKFCTWLSKKEGKLYRLPTDQEWSIAVDISRDEKWRSDTTPSNVFKDQNTFPWGNAWPPPKGAGNYSDVSRHAKAPGDNRPLLEGYDDTFPTTSPVMSFEPNKVGLYDMGGNVWEWVEDFYDNAKKDRVLRGGSWLNYEPGGLLSSSRLRKTPDTQHHLYGFRVVLLSSGG
mgnify:CR=1 FL=1